MLLASLRKDSKTAEPSDPEVIDAVQNGDVQAFRTLVERYQTRAFHVAKRVLRSDQDAEEVVQEAFVKAYLSLNSFKGESRFYTWFYRIVFNMAVDVRRKQQRRGGDAVEYIEDVVGLDTKEESGEQPEATVANRELLGLVHEAMKQLTPEHREVLVMREFDGLSYDEIADILNVNKGTVMSRLFYARKNLQVLLQQVAEPEVADDQTASAGSSGSYIAQNATKA